MDSSLLDMPAASALIEFYRQNPIIALEELLHIELAVPQRLVFKDMWNNNFVIITAGRGCGKSFLIAAFASLRALLYPGIRIGFLAPSFRQCVVGSTYVQTEAGFSRVADIKGKPTRLLADSGLFPCSAMYRNLAEPTVKVVLSNGIGLEGAPAHRVVVMDGEGFPRFKELCQLTDSDFVCVKTGSHHFGKNTSIGGYREPFVSRGNLQREFLPDVLDEELSYFVGLITGDGCVTHEGYIHFSNTDSDILAAYKTSCAKYFGRFSLQNKGNSLVDVSVGNKLGFAFLKNIGLGGKHSEQKTIPPLFLTAPRECQCAFLRGLFDTDGCVYLNTAVSHPYKVHIAFVSEELIDQIQLLLLNMGILSVKGVNTSPLRKNPLYCLEISSKTSLLLFREFVGFFCARKKEKLDVVCGRILGTDVHRSNKDFVPFVGPRLASVITKIRKSNQEPFEFLKLWVLFNRAGDFVGGATSVTQGFIQKLWEYCCRNGIHDDYLWQLKELIDSGMVFLRVASLSAGFDYTYDFTVEERHRYISNGLVSHNSKIAFEEVRKMWLASSLFREATTGRPTFQSDRCILNFKSSGRTPPSLIEADPLGTGDKIRGLRLHVLLIDEFAQMPEVLFDTVIKPMAATTRSPMERVKVVQQMKRLREGGASEESLESYGAANKIIMVSSAYYKFNHMYRRIEQYQSFISKGLKDYAVRRVSYSDMPEGFLSEDIINEAKATMPVSLFRMEYEALWESDSDGVFKASLLSQRILPPGDTLRKSAQNGLVQHIISCDPARTSDYFSIVVFELGDPVKVVNVLKYHKTTYPRMAEIIMDLCDKYNVVRLVIDSQGGGHAVKDLLADSAKFGKNIIIDMDDESFNGVTGRRFLQMVNPSPSYNSEANYATLNLLEQSKLWFAGIPTSGDEQDEKDYELVRELIQQLLNIVVTQTRSGIVHFDVPTGGGHGAQKKDLYSAFIYGAHKAYQLAVERSSTEDIIWDIGVVRTAPQHSSSSGFGGTKTSHSAVLGPRR